VTILDTGNPIADLRDRVDRLTIRHVVRVTGPDGTYKGDRPELPLLTQLRDAITANIGPGNGNKALHERSNHNSTASQLFSDIEKPVRQWAITAGYVPNGHPVEEVLRGWYSAVYLDRDLDLRYYNAALADWIDQIVNLFDPPHRYPLNAPCPICGQTWVTSIEDGHEKRSYALNVVERDAPDPIHLVTCRNPDCGATWHGIEGAEALSALLHTGSVPVIPPQEAHA
jgi:hypothetical protein